MLGPRFIAVATLVAALITAAPARAEPDATAEARARDAYERGSIALRSGDYARAGAEFAQADAIAPNPVTLRAALNAATLADDPVLGTELLARADGRPADRALTEVMATARARFAHRTGRIVVRCPSATRCLGTVDGTAVETSKPRIVAVGVHTVTLQGDGPLEERMTWVAADQTVEVATTPPKAEPSPPSRPASERPREAAGLSPVWFFTAAAVTAVATGVTIWSTVDTANRHTSFADARCDEVPGPSCGSLAGDGIAAQRRTDVLAIGTGALAVGTAALGLFVVRWGSSQAQTVGLVWHGAGASLHASF